MSAEPPAPYDHVVWDRTQPDSTGPHFGPITKAEADRWRGRENFWVQRLPALLHPSDMPMTSAQSDEERA